MGNTHSASNKKRVTPSNRSKASVENRSSEKELDQKNTDTDIEEEPVSLAEEIAVELEHRLAARRLRRPRAHRHLDVHLGAGARAGADRRRARAELGGREHGRHAAAGAAGAAAARRLRYLVRGVGPRQ